MYWLWRESSSTETSDHIWKLSPLGSPMSRLSCGYSRRGFSWEQHRWSKPLEGLHLPLHRLKSWTLWTSLSTLCHSFASSVEEQKRFNRLWRSEEWGASRLKRSWQRPFTRPAKVASLDAPLHPCWLQQCRYLLQRFFFTSGSSQSRINKRFHLRRILGRG